MGKPLASKAVVVKASITGVQSGWAGRSPSPAFSSVSWIATSACLQPPVKSTPPSSPWLLTPLAGKPAMASSKEKDLRMSFMTWARRLGSSTTLPRQWPSSSAKAGTAPAASR